MIRRFSTLYVGHIELERCGLDGVPADDRRYSNERLAETFETAIAMAPAPDRLGAATPGPARDHLPPPGVWAADSPRGAPPTPPAGESLAADRERQPAQPRLHGRSLHQGRRLRHRRERRPALVRRLPGRRAPPRPRARAR